MFRIMHKQLYIHRLTHIFQRYIQISSVPTLAKSQCSTNPTPHSKLPPNEKNLHELSFVYVVVMLICEL